MTKFRDEYTETEYRIECYSNVLQRFVPVTPVATKNLEVAKKHYEEWIYKYNRRYKIKQDKRGYDINSTRIVKREKIVKATLWNPID